MYHYPCFKIKKTKTWGFPGGKVVKNPPALGQEDSLEEGKATHSTIFAWEIPWTEEPDKLQSMGSPRVRLK